MPFSCHPTTPPHVLYFYFTHPAQLLPFHISCPPPPTFKSQLGPNGKTLKKAIMKNIVVFCLNVHGLAINDEKIKLQKEIFLFQKVIVISLYLQRQKSPINSGLREQPETLNTMPRDINPLCLAMGPGELLY